MLDSGVLLTFDCQFKRCAQLQPPRSSLPRYLKPPVATATYTLRLKSNSLEFGVALFIKSLHHSSHAVALVRPRHAHSDRSTLILAATQAQASAPPRLHWADETRLGRPFSKDPCVVRFEGRYLMYFSLPPFEKTLAPDQCASGLVHRYCGKSRSDDLEEGGRALAGAGM